MTIHHLTTSPTFTTPNAGPQSPNRFMTILLCMLTLAAFSGTADAIRIKPGSPFAPAPNTPRAGEPVPAAPTPAQWNTPTVELLIIVRLLNDLVQARTLSLTAAQRAQLTVLLVPLGRQTTLSPDQAQDTLDRLLRVVGTAGQRQLTQARAQLDRRVNLELASSRYARGEDMPSIAFFRVALLLPGGQAVAGAVLHDPNLNPFLQGVPAQLLKRLTQAV